MSNEIIRIKIDPKAFIATLPNTKDRGVELDDGIISVYLADIFGEAGVEAEARYHDTDWNVVVKEEKYYIGVDFSNDPEASLLKSIRDFLDELNSMNDFEAWYSYRNKMHYLNLKQKDPETKSEEV
jgi:hypothetical protein